MTQATRRPFRALLFLALLTSVNPRAGAAPVPVQLRETDGKWQLLRDGRPYVIKGAGGDGSRTTLVALGGNSVRTWGSDGIDKQLDEADRLGLTVTVGIWLGQERQGFNYHSAEQVAAQRERARAAILRYKDHPAVLMWAIGNEMEGYGAGDNAAIWAAVQEIAAITKHLDPNHPTMTVVAEIGGERVRSVHRLCPDVDVLGINTYAGITSIPRRYRDAGGTKPYVITEFGPPGTWEVEKTAWGAVPEPTSTRKASIYHDGYVAAVESQAGRCLGSYVFLWGFKQEATATWFGMFLPDGRRLGPVDAISEMWTGKAPPQPCPQIDPIALTGPAEVDPGATVRAAAKVTAPSGERVDLKWVLAREAAAYRVGGDAEAATATFPDAISNPTAAAVDVKMPKDGGGYRLYCYATDAHGGAALANVPLFVKGAAVAAAPRHALPFILYGAGADADARYVPSGWMGNTAAIALDEKFVPPGAAAGATCIRAAYKAADGFGGVVWQDPPNDWGDRPGGTDLTGAAALTFRARGEKGGEIVKFEFGVLGADKKYRDSSGDSTEITLTADWKRYSIDLRGKDLTRIKTGFGWVVAGRPGGTVFYLDDVRYEGSP